MNKFILLTVLLLFCGNAVFAQDTIFSKRYKPLIGTVAKADRKLVYIQLQYKPKTSLFSIKKSQVEYIHYADGKIELINPPIIVVSEVAEVKLVEKPEPLIPAKVDSPVKKEVEKKEVQPSILKQDTKKEGSGLVDLAPKSSAKYETKIGLGMNAAGIGFSLEHALFNPQFSLEARISLNPGGGLFKRSIGNFPNNESVELPENQNFSYRDNISLSNDNSHFRMDQLFSLHLNYFISPTPSKFKPFATIGLGAGLFSYILATTTVKYEGTLGPDEAKFDEYSSTLAHEVLPTNGTYYSAGIGLSYEIKPRLSINVAFDFYAVDYNMENRRIKLNDKSGETSFAGYTNGYMVKTGFFVPVSLKFTL
jgi:hypothetical protein